MKTRALGILIMVVVITTAIWAFIIIIDQATSSPVSTLSEKIESLSSLSFLFYLSYVNAGMITLLSVAMFAGFYLYCLHHEPLWSTIGFAFVPIYGLGNIIVYLSQVLVVPRLLDLYYLGGKSAAAEVILGLTIHGWTGSAMEALNGLSYALLGIPSFIFSVIMYRREKALRLGSVLLALSGLLSVAALLGIATGNPALSMMSLIAGFVYLVSLIPIGLFFSRRTGRS